MPKLLLTFRLPLLASVLAFHSLLRADVVYKSIYTADQIARFSAQAESALRQGNHNQKTIFGIMILKNLLEDRYEGLFRTFRQSKPDPIQIEAKYKDFENAFDKLTAQSPYQVSGSTQVKANLFLDLLIASKDPRAVAIGTGGKIAKDPLFKVYEWYQELPGKAHQRRAEFLNRFREADQNLPALLGALVSESQYNPDLRGLLENKIYPSIGFGPSDSEEKRRQVVPSFFLLEAQEKSNEKLQDLAKTIDGIKSSIQEKTESGKNSSELNTPAPKPALTDKSQHAIADQMNRLQQALPKLIENREKELEQNAVFFSAASQMIGNLNTVLYLSGYDDSTGTLKASVMMAQASSKIATLSTSYIKSAMDAASKGMKMDFSSQFSISMNILGTFLDLAVALTPGMSAEAQMMQAMHQMIQELKEYIKQEFNIVNQKLDLITATLDQEFKRQSLLIEQNSEQIEQLQSRLSNLQDSLSQQTNLILNAMEAGFEEIHQRETKDCKAGRLDWKICRDHIVDHALNNSSNSLRLFQIDFRELSFSDIVGQLKRSLFKNVAVLEHLGRARAQINSSEDLNSTLINPQVWAVSVNQYLDLLENATPQELKKELPNVQALLKTYERFRAPMVSLFDSKSDLFRSIFNKYEAILAKLRTGVAREAQLYLNTHQKEFVNAEAALNSLSENVQDTEKLLAKNVSITEFPAGTQLMPWPVERYQSERFIMPEGLGAVIDPRWHIAQRRGLVTLTPLLKMWTASSKKCYFAIGIHAKSKALNEKGEPEFQGLIKYFGKVYDVPKIYTYDGAYDHGSCVRNWPLIVKTFISTAHDNDFYDAHEEFNFGKSRGYAVDRNLSWLWEVWPLTKSPAPGTPAAARHASSYSVIKNYKGNKITFHINRIFSQATIFEGLEYLEKKIDPEVRSFYAEVFSEINQHLLGKARNQALENESRTQLSMLSEFIKDLLLLGHSQSLEALSTKSPGEGFALFNSVKLLEKPSECENGKCPDYVSLLYAQHTKDFSVTRDTVLAKLAEHSSGWEEPAPFLQIRRRLLAIQELLRK